MFQIALPGNAAAVMAEVALLNYALAPGVLFTFRGFGNPTVSHAILAGLLYGVYHYGIWKVFLVPESVKEDNIHKRSTIEDTKPFIYG